MRKKTTNAQKILKALQNGPKTQADLLKETKVKNTYQIVFDLVQKGLAVRDGRLVKLTDSGSPETKPTKAEPIKVKAPADSERLIMIRDEIENITDGIRSLMITRSYLIRRAQEERANA
jgi:hypothetical protein